MLSCVKLDKLFSPTVHWQSHTRPVGLWLDRLSDKGWVMTWIHNAQLEETIAAEPTIIQQHYCWQRSIRCTAVSGYYTTDTSVSHRSDCPAEDDRLQTRWPASELKSHFESPGTWMHSSHIRSLNAGILKNTVHIIRNMRTAGVDSIPVSTLFSTQMSEANALCDAAGMF